MVKLRKIGLALALAATVAVVLMMDDAPEDIAPARKVSADVAVRTTLGGANTAGANVAGAATEAASLPEKMARADYATETTNLFPVRSWLPPPPVLPPEKPKAPPLPFRYLGKLDADDGLRIFLGDQQRNLVVRAGDTLNGVYQVEEVTASGMTFTYLPLKEKQQLNFGSVN